MFASIEHLNLDSSDAPSTAVGRAQSYTVRRTLVWWADVLSMLRPKVLVRGVTCHQGGKVTPPAHSEPVDQHQLKPFQRSIGLTDLRNQKSRKSSFSVRTFT